MKSTKFINNISDTLKAKIPKLKPQQIVTFQMLNGVPNPDPDEKERSKDPILYGKVQVRTNFRVYDEHIKDASGNEVGGYVDCGCVDQWSGDTPEKFRFFVPGMGEYSRFGGKFSLQGGNVKDEELYEILWLSPEREGSPCKDESVQPLFKILDIKGDSKSSLNKVDRLRKALKLSETISEADARGVMAALNQPTYQDKEVLMAKIGELARDNYELFLSTYDDPMTKVKADIKTALDSGLIKHDAATGAITIGTVKLTDLKIDGNQSLVDELTNFVNSATNGEDVLSNIRKQLDKKAAKS